MNTFSINEYKFIRPYFVCIEMCACEKVYFK
jgi:hypothetical protein